MIPVSAPSRVRSLLLGSPDASVPVVHRGPDAVYLDVQGRCVGVLSRHATAVPCGLGTALETVPEAASARIEGGVLLLDDVPLPIGRIRDVAVPRLRASRLRTTRPGPAPAPGEVAAMLGRGDGLTPYDDDVLCGWLAAHRAAGVATPAVDAAVLAGRHRTTLLSATLLECAMHGEVIPEFAAWLAAPDDQDRTAALAAVGHSSGRGLLHGARLALTHLAPEGIAA